ncbi:hypothetical protein [Synechococcus sp. CCY 9618]|uniref:hypothetical protein n=1 Tax=Synechococcus sp. CCY 9618 TaxID=2815602 RepID=UPI0020B1CC9E|nr:hypothetical protein [Synechococcus sp. CCY 9618]
MPQTPHPLHLPTPKGPAPGKGLQLRRKRRRPSSRWRQTGAGLLLILAGALILTGLMQLPERLDALLLVSNAIANLISGLSRLMMGVLQLGSVIVVALLALLALLLLVGGSVRLVRAVSSGHRHPP